MDQLAGADDKNPLTIRASKGGIIALPVVFFVGLPAIRIKCAGVQYEGIARHLIAVRFCGRLSLPKHAYNGIESVRWLIRANFPSGFLEPLGLFLVANLRLSFLLFADFSHTATHLLAVR
jgi:hypothetical protein